MNFWQWPKSSILLVFQQVAKVSKVYINLSVTLALIALTEARQKRQNVVYTNQCKVLISNSKALHTGKSLERDHQLERHLTKVTW